MTWVNLASWLPCTESEGPGKRAALWVQGCDKRCIGCCNPHYLKLVEREIISAKTIEQRLIQAQKDFDIEGITLLGGEPLLQAQGLSVIAKCAQTIGLSVMVFSGYTYEELLDMKLLGADQLLANTDVFVDGVYDAQQPETVRNWVGSVNQRFHYLSTRYNQSIETDHLGKHSVEWRIKSDGIIKINGWPIKLSV
jgi:anaerobic ribonucleoside-triphosphate reductase activating protein